MNIYSSYGIGTWKDDDFLWREMSCVLFKNVVVGGFTWINKEKEKGRFFIIGYPRFFWIVLKESPELKKSLYQFLNSGMRTARCNLVVVKTLRANKQFYIVSITFLEELLNLHISETNKQIFDDENNGLRKRVLNIQK